MDGCISVGVIHAFLWVLNEGKLNFVLTFKVTTNTIYLFFNMTFSSMSKNKIGPGFNRILLIYHLYRDTNNLVSLCACKCSNMINSRTRFMSGIPTLT